MQKVYRVARQVAGSRATVLVTGESGTGKAKSRARFHALSPRARQPSFRCDCAALAESLLESELFGHEKGSFTGAEKAAPRALEQADGGTLFLDENRRHPAAHAGQAAARSAGADIRARRRQRADQGRRAGHRRDPSRSRERRRRGGASERPVLPPERRPHRHAAAPLRGADVVVLASHFLQRFALENHKRVEGFSEAARSKILGFRWPATFAPSKTPFERAVVLCEGTVIDADDLPFEAAPEIQVPSASPAPPWPKIERYSILKTLEAVEGSTAKKRRAPHISVRTIQYRLNEYGLGKFHR